MRKKIVVIFIGIIIFVGILCFYRWSQQDFLPGEETEMVLNFDSINKKLFIRTRSWGIAGNHEEIILSENDKMSSNKETDYIFYTSEIYYKIDPNKKLIIYVPENCISIPSKKFTNVDVIIKELTTLEEIDDYHEHFQKYGLSKVSIYVNK